MMKKFTIKKDHHYSTHFLRPYILKDKVEFAFKLSSNCSYFFGNENDSDINKLFGVSFGYHHNNSIRIGWRWNQFEKCFEILPYIYKNGQRIPEWQDKIYGCITKINADEAAYCSIEINDTNFIITIIKLDSVDSVLIPKPKLTKFGYYLYPYFGGQEKAPHDMDIYLEY